MSKNEQQSPLACPQCGGPPVEGCDPFAASGRGMVVTEGKDRLGRTVPVYSDCPGMERVYRDHHLAASGVGARFRGSTLENFDTGWGGRVAVLRAAHRTASDYVENFRPLGEDDPTTTGLLLHGEPGGGKTHLAVAILQAIISRYVIKGLFADFTTLCAEIQSTFDDPQISKATVINPVISAPLLVLDELGAAKPTDWVLDTLYLIINNRYNENRPTIFTTNYQLASSHEPSHVGDRSIGSSTKATALAPRVGARIASRLYEMTRPVPLVGVGDYREKNFT